MTDAIDAVTCPFERCGILHITDYAFDVWVCGEGPCARSPQKTANPESCMEEARDNCLANEPACAGNEDERPMHVYAVYYFSSEGCP